MGHIFGLKRQQKIDYFRNSEVTLNKKIYDFEKILFPDEQITVSEGGKSGETTRMEQSLTEGTNFVLIGLNAEDH